MLAAERIEELEKQLSDAESLLRQWQAERHYRWTKLADMTREFVDGLAVGNDDT